MSENTEVSIVETKVVRENTCLYQSRTGSNKIEKPEDAVDFMASFLRSTGREHVYVICLDGADTPVAVSNVFIGSNNLSLCSPAEIIKLALLVNSPIIILIHTHPSGNTKPSNEDDKITIKMKEACQLFDIKLVDHIIIGDSGNGSNLYYSYAEEGRL